MLETINMIANSLIYSDKFSSVFQQSQFVSGPLKVIFGDLVLSLFPKYCSCFVHQRFFSGLSNDIVLLGDLLLN